MGKDKKMPVSRRGFIAGAGTLAAGTMGFPLIGGAQPAAVKVGIIHPVTGFVAYAGSQGRFGATLAVDDINKAGGINAMGGAKLEPLLGDSRQRRERAERRGPGQTLRYFQHHHPPLGVICVGFVVRCRPAARSLRCAD